MNLTLIFGAVVAALLLVSLLVALLKPEKFQ